MSVIDCINAMEERIMDELISRNYEPGICQWGIRVSTGVDTWIIDVRSANETEATVILHHKNNIYKPRFSNYKIPGYHRQLSGKFSPERIVDVIEEHKNKWLGKRSREKAESNKALLPLA